MKVFKINEAKPDARNNLEIYKLDALELKGLNLQLVYHLPGQKMDGKAPKEHTLFIISGELTITSSVTGTFVVGPGDAIHYKEGDERVLENTSKQKTGVLLIDTAPNQGGAGGPGGPGGLPPFVK